MKKRIFLFLLFCMSSFLLLNIGCGTPPEKEKDNPSEKKKKKEIKRPKGWGEASHSKKEKADYKRIFNTQKVQRIDLKIAASNWKFMFAHMNKVAGEFGKDKGKDPGAPPGGERPDLKVLVVACKGKKLKTACKFKDKGKEIKGFCDKIPFGGGRGLICLPKGFGGLKPPRGSGALKLLSGDPIYIPAELKYEGKTWTKIGFRLKGNSSLSKSWAEGNYKLPFRLDMDEFEKEYPETNNQRLYGFKKLTFSNGFSDSSYIREFVGGELFREAGVPIAQASFYRVYIDYGEGSKYFGVYTLVEDPNGPMLKTQFKKDSGNLYKPDGSGASWTKFSQKSFVKKTNKKEADWSDIQNAIKALHSSRTNGAKWRLAFEKLFDVDIFLRWLAIKTMMLHWDSYGALPHNYYLYADPSQKKKLIWISWDHNMTLLEFGPSSTSLGLKSVNGKKWPLIRYLMDQPIYAAKYKQYVKKFSEGIFKQSKVLKRMKEMHKLITPYVIGKEAEKKGYSHVTLEAFQNAIDGQRGLANLLKKRHQAIKKYLEE